MSSRIEVLCWPKNSVDLTVDEEELVENLNCLKDMKNSDMYMLYYYHINGGSINGGGDWLDKYTFYDGMGYDDLEIEAKKEALYAGIKNKVKNLPSDMYFTKDQYID